MFKKILNKKYENEMDRISTFYNIFDEDIEDLFTDVCLEGEERQSSAMRQFLLVFTIIMFESGLFSSEEYENYVDNPDKVLDDFIKEYKIVKKTDIDKYHVFGILHYLMSKDLLIQIIHQSDKPSLTGFIKSLPEDILDQIIDPLKERYLDHLCYYYECDNDHDLDNIINLDEEYEKIHNRDYDNLLVYFDPKSLYAFERE